MGGNQLGDAQAIELFLRSARIDGNDRLYTIGPFGSRVSFASQQRRALNTVWALEQQGTIKAGDRVAVIGAGLAGVMTAVALAARKCVVHLYEREAAVLQLQQNTTHRFVHPTVNFWPEQPLNPTTTFPFLDWYADKCSEVIDKLREEWIEYFERWITRLFLETTVENLEMVDGGIEVRASGKNAPSPAQTYGAVVLAVGFGDERTVVGIDGKSYWERDDLANREGASEISAVSGTGDGGLIDILRVVHRNFRKGRLCLDLIKVLDETGIKDLMADLESSVLKSHAKNQEAASVAYYEGYNTLLEDAPPAALQLLDNSLRTDLTEPVTLIGRTSRPFSLTAAPIHKFLLAHALRSGVVIYQKGELHDGPNLDPGPLKEPCVVRHGPKNDMAGLIDDEQIKHLRERQLVISDLLASVPYDGSYWARWRDYPEQDFQNPVFVQLRYTAAVSYVNKAFSELLHKEDKLYFVIQQPLKPDLSRLMPSALFGIRTEVREQKVYQVT